MPARKMGLRPPIKDWAFLAYIAADNNLSDYGLRDIAEMCKVGASHQTHVGVEIDTYGEHTGSIRYEISEPDWTGQAHRIVIERLGEKDSGDPATLRSFIKWGLMRFRAQNYLGVIWNHGSGFRSIRRDIGYDDFGSSLDMPEIVDALRRSGVGPRRRLAILGFDACLMNMLEIVNHLQTYVDIVVGSQQTEPGDGWPYDQVLKLFRRRAGKTAIASGIVKAYIDDYRRKGVYDVTQSAVDVEKTEPAVRALKELGRRLNRYYDEYRGILRLIRLQLQNFEMSDYVDLIHLAELIIRRIDNIAIMTAAKEVIRTTRESIIASATRGSTVQNAHGLSVWFPAQRHLYFAYRAKYMALRCNSRSPGWVQFLDRYHQ